MRAVLLFFRSRRRGRLEGRPQFGPKRLGKLRQLFFVAASRCFLVLALTTSCSFAASASIDSTFRPIRVLEQRDQSLAGPSPVTGVERGLEHGAQPVIIGLGDRVIAMVVALRHSRPSDPERRADDLEGISHDRFAANGSSAAPVDVPSAAVRRKPVAASNSVFSGVNSVQGRRTSSSPANCSMINRSSGLSALIDRTT